ncbi:palmdelphin isoform X2 [Acanthochromis polyacanthus]|uniref:palmdelphin isoform X2 n=1 Tax=Acanthochromis polyacanthus TaxID=80966 RepID=UPI0022340123|nr:palmdelphin isoform X2 [Acanthochromis polyacanthus]
MEECDLLKERLQAITERHRIQEDIRQKKLELDQEKLKVQHLKKKALREQWLLKDSTVLHAGDSTQQQNLLSDQQQTRALQLHIHKIEMEVEALEREESMISTNETFILTRLKAVEKSSEAIIKEVQDSFVPEPVQVATVIPDIPESLSSPSSTHSEPNTTRKTVFAMDMNVTKNMLTGENTVLSTATVPPEEFHQHNGLKVFDDGRKCVYALSPPEGSHDQSSVSELSANEVEQLLRSATVHRQATHQSYHQNPRKREDLSFCSRQDLRDREQERYRAEEDFTWQRKPHDDHRCHQESLYIRHQDRSNHGNLRERQRLGNHNGLHHGNQSDRHCSSYKVRDHHSVQEDRPTSHQTNGIVRTNSGMNGSRSSGFSSLRSHDQEVVMAHQPQLSYTPASYIPLKDYISVDEEELYRYNRPSYIQTENSLSQSSALYGGPAHCDRVPSPLYGDDTPYTILTALDTTEPITAIFMGFQTAQDDSGVQEFDGSLKAELVIIEDTEDHHEDLRKEKKNHVQGPGSSTNRLLEGGGGRTEKRVGAGNV